MRGDAQRDPAQVAEQLTREQLHRQHDRRPEHDVDEAGHGHGGAGDGVDPGAQPGALTGLPPGPPQGVDLSLVESPLLPRGPESHFSPHF
ncbi:hypothetical protein Ae717Ps2_6366c [Pseudonocardia sp. Ae717_Ps2]|nr:hypothetical protein Ae717Ps2_6366c [Pseudonocardia sp. Ae717_Ps2]